MRSREVRRVFQEGRPLHTERVVVFLAPGQGTFAVVAARRVGGAVDRNRARRILREAWMRVSPQVSEGFDIVLVAREAIRGAKTQDLVADMTQVLQRAEMTRA